MIVYSVIMLVVGLVVSSLAKKIRDGKIDLIHDYHIANIKESKKELYCMEMSESLNIMAVSMFVSGGFVLINSNKTMVILSVILLIVGLIVSIVRIINIQKEYK